MIKNFSKKQGFIIPLVITIVAILAIGGVVYLAPEKKVEAPVAPVLVDTSDWKTYKNEKYGFEIRYPQDWLIEDNLDSNRCCLNMFDGAKNKIQIQYYKNESLSGETLIIDNVKVIKHKGDTFEDSLIYYIPFESNQGLRYLFWNKDESYIKIAEKIISTLKFTTPVKETPVACTTDAMMCSDGSYVGRSGPKCEFVCPTNSCVSDWSCEWSKCIIPPCAPGIDSPACSKGTQHLELVDKNKCSISSKNTSISCPAISRICE